MSYRIAFFVLCASLADSAGNSYGWAHDVKPSPCVVTVTVADAGSKVKLVLGQELQVKLDAQLGAGFSWRVDSESSATLSAAGTSVQSGSAKPGGVETQVLSFKAAKSGTGSLKLLYSQPWKKEATATKEFTLRVTVSDTARPTSD